jgi:hypothetical protein
MAEQKVIDRFNSKVKKLESGCWVFTGSKDRDGYGYAYCKDKMDKVPAHRLSWIINNGPIPKGLSVCHSCDNPPCVRIDHLWLGTQKENMLDMIKKNRKNGRKKMINPIKIKPEKIAPIKVNLTKVISSMKKLTINIEDNLHKELKIICANNDVSIKDVITRFITEFINLNSKGPQ